MILYRVIWYNLPALHKMGEDWWILSCVNDEKMIFYKEEKKKSQKTQPFSWKAKEANGFGTDVIISKTEYQEAIDLLKYNWEKMDNWEQIESPDFTLNYPEEWFKFNSYWTEKDRKGRTRAELQKTFDIKRRFANWISNKTESKITTKPTICKL